VDVFESAGVNLNQVVIGHLNDIVDQPAVVPIAIAKRGAYVAFDHSGKPDDPRGQEYVRTIMAVLDAGHEDRVCLSADFSSEKYLRKNGGPGIDMIMTTIVPRLRRAGVNDATMHKILVENPRRAISFVPKKASGDAAGAALHSRRPNTQSESPEIVATICLPSTS
jgi:phosphotriesterase-related protein